MIMLNGFKNTTPLEKRSRRFRAASVAIGTVAAIVFVLCAIAMQASAQGMSTSSGNANIYDQVQESLRWQQIMSTRAEERYQVCKTQREDWVCMREKVANLDAIYRQGAAMRGVVNPTLPPPGSGTYAQSGTTTCRWVGINWNCDYPGGRATSCRWVGQNWVCG